MSTLANLWLTRRIRQREKRLGIKLMSLKERPTDNDTDNQPHKNNND